MASTNYHESSIFWQRLQKVYDSSNHSHQSLADQIGVNRKTVQRILAGETYRDMITVIYDIALACGVTPDLLFDSKRELPYTPLTGIASIDRMLMAIHNVESVGHIEPYAPYVHKDYLMFRGSDEEFTGASGTWRPREGITFEKELELNLMSANTNNTKRRSTLVKGYIAGEQVVAVNEVEVFSVLTGKVHQTARFIEHLELERSLDEHVENPRLVPKIIRRHWAELKMKSIA